MSTWQLQQAKAHFSEVVRNAIQEGPQKVTVHGKPVVVILSEAEFNKLCKPKPSLVELMQKSPLKGLKLDLARDKSLPREIDL